MRIARILTEVLPKMLTATRPKNSGHATAIPTPAPLPMSPRARFQYGGPRHGQNQAARSCLALRRAVGRGGGLENAPRHDFAPEHVAGLPSPRFQVFRCFLTCPSRPPQPPTPFRQALGWGVSSRSCRGGGGDLGVRGKHRLQQFAMWCWCVDLRRAIPARASLPPKTGMLYAAVPTHGLSQTYTQLLP